METIVRPAFLRGKKTVLRPLSKKTDMEKCWQWVNTQETWNFLGGVFPISYGEEEKWFDSLDARKNALALGIEAEDGAFIGTMGLHDMDWVHRHATTGAMIGEKEYLGKGYGQDAKMTLLGYAFGVLNFRKIYSQAFACNMASIHYNLRCGFHLEGVCKQHYFRNGEYIDQALLAVFAHEWLVYGKQYQETGLLQNDAHVAHEIERLKTLCD